MSTPSRCCYSCRWVFHRCWNMQCGTRRWSREQLISSSASDTERNSSSSNSNPAFPHMLLWRFSFSWLLSLLFSSSIWGNISRQNDFLFYKWNKFFRQLDTLISLSNLLDRTTGNPFLKELFGGTNQLFFNTRQLLVLTLNYSLFLRRIFSNVVTILSFPFCAAFCIFFLSKCFSRRQPFCVFKIVKSFSLILFFFTFFFCLFQRLAFLAF